MAREEKHVARLEPAREYGGLRDFAGLESWGALRDFPVSRLMQGLMQDFFDRDRPSFAQPYVDVVENEHGYSLSVELPGVKPSDVTIEARNGTLSIRGEKKSERDEKGERGRLLERRYGAFSRMFTLPEDADSEQCKASFQDGVLRIDVQKRPEAKPRTIPIKG